MLKEVVRYTDYNDVEQEETLYFNLTKTEMMDLMDLQPRLEAWSKATENPGEMQPTQIKELLDIVKLLIEKSYGVRSDDGKHFRKTPEIYDDFQQSAAYDAFVFSLFEYPERAISFMAGILPKGLDDKALTEAKAQAEQIGNQLQAMREGREIMDVPMPAEKDMVAVDQEVPAYIREGREPTRQELQGMSKEELQAAFARRGTNQ